MKISNLNEWLTLISNVGVLIGIIFLAAELQQNSNIAQADSYRQIVQDISNWRSEINGDPELLELWLSYTSENRLMEMEPHNRVKVIFLVNNIFGSLESAYYSREHGIISELEWQRFEISACNHFGFATQKPVST